MKLILLLFSLLVSPNAIAVAEPVSNSIQQYSAHNPYGKSLYDGSRRIKKHRNTRKTTKLPKTLMVYERKKVGNVPYGSVINNCSVPGAVALTFSGGPGPSIDLLLKMLAENDIKATFFIVGQKLLDQKKNAHKILTKMYRDNHQIGSMGMHYLSYKETTPIDQQRDIRRFEMVFKSYGPKKLTKHNLVPSYFRDAFYTCEGTCRVNLADMGYHQVRSNRDLNDWRKDVEASKKLFDEAIAPIIQHRGEKNAYFTSLILLTVDYEKSTVEQLVPYIIRQLKKNQLQTMTVGECLNDPKENWYMKPTRAKRQAPTTENTANAAAAV